MGVGFLRALLLALAIPCGVAVTGTQTGGQDSLLIWRGGRSSDAPDPTKAALIEDVLAGFAAADTTYKYLVTPDRLEKARRGKAVELILSVPREAKCKALHEPVRLSRLLIPLDPDFASIESLIFFYGDPEYGEFNVVAARSGSRTLLDKLLKTLFAKR